VIGLCRLGGMTVGWLWVGSEMTWSSAGKCGNKMICWCCVSLFLGVSLFSLCDITDIVWVLCGIKCITVGVLIREGLMSYSKSTPVSGCIPFQQPVALPSVRVWGCYRSISNLYNDLHDNSGGKWCNPRIVSGLAPCHDRSKIIPSSMCSATPLALPAVIKTRTGIWIQCVITHNT
jgi:hypothetical protein